MFKKIMLIFAVILMANTCYAVSFKNLVFTSDHLNCQPTYTQDPNIVLPHPSVNCNLETTHPWWLPYNKYTDTSLHLTPTELQQRVESYKNVRWY
ncbi:MAG: hypothetical protein LKG27_00585 [Clostridiaceae bacterium]|jgi:hypothetical protein|nr:hypothetical protein [Clostridiaceae bacterium]